MTLHMNGWDIFVKSNWLAAKKILATEDGVQRYLYFAVHEGKEEDRHMYKGQSLRA